jgi:peptidoglycan/LPS O-acetylase OafA/YrhL
MRERLLLELLYGAGSSLAILGLVELERSAAIKVGGLMLLLGDASYAIYRVHVPALAMLAKAFESTGLRRFPVQLSFVIIVASATAAGVALHLGSKNRCLNS